ncbi:ABC transporter FUM19 [Colletotrichum sp. SAR 10_98]|nr:ABC transporter FUM19 [Colletotrichum sp. SAR 10_98]
MNDQDNNCIADVAFGLRADCDAHEFPVVEYRWIFWLSVATAAVFVAVAALRALRLARSRDPSVVCGAGMMWIAKLVAGAVFTGLRLGLLVVVLRQQNGRPNAELVASTALNFTASCLLLALSPLEHFKRSRPSILACSFLFLALIYDIYRCPSLWSASDQQNNQHLSLSFKVLFTTAIVVEVLFLALESLKRRRWLKWDSDEHSPEETSSILSLGLYSWLNPLLWKGYQKPLVMDDLFPLDTSISVAKLDTRRSPESKGTSISDLVLWLARPLGWSVLLPILPRLCLLGFTFCQPFFLQRLLGFLSSNEDNSSTASGLVAVAVLTYSGIAISTALYWYYQERFQSLLRAYLISAIYRKTAEIQHVGDGDSAAVTLMGADVERIYTGLRLMHEVWANAIQIGLASWLLQRQLGLAFLAPLVIVLICFFISFAISKRAVPYQSAWMARVQKRIAATSAVLSDIKDLRVSGMIRPAAALVQREREDEIRVGERSRILIAISASSSQLPQAIAPALAFAFGPKVLDETRAFTALSFLALLTSPLLVVLQSLPIIAASFACLRRIKLFLAQETRVDGRHIVASTDTDEKAGKSTIEVKSKEAFISIQGGSFGWTDDKPVLKDISIYVPQSSIIFVVGPVASGKSTFCRALLGEVPHAKGTVTLGSKKLAYCDQTPFLFNSSIMENIIGFSPLNTARYADVIHAAMLLDDLATMPAGDRTVVGTKGVSLSGGQRQRISLARALYHEADILVLDDVFRGLDSSTQHQVCQAIFGINGLLRRRGTTVIVCTHSTQLLPVADNIIALTPEGTILDHGTFIDITEDEERARRFGLTSITEAITRKSKKDTTADEMEISPSREAREASQPLKAATVPKAQSTSATIPTVDLAVYRHWLSTMKPLPLISFAVLVIGVGFCANFPTIWLKFWSADSTSSSPQHSFAYWMGLYALIGAGGVICVFPAGLIILRTAVRLAGTDLHHATVDTVMNSSLRFLSTTDVGKILNLFSQDMNIMDTQLPRMINNLCFCLATAIGQAAVIAVSSAWLSISYPFFVLLLWVVQRIYLPTSKRLLAVVAVLLVALATQLRSDTGNVGAGLVTLITFGGTLTTIVVAYTGLETSLGAIGRLKAFGEETEREDSVGDDITPDEAWPLNGHVDIRNVDVSYNGGDKVLKGLNMSFEPGQKVAICGRTGSGKSSILALLLRLIDPLQASTFTNPQPAIMIDGVPLNTVNRITLRERVISASQDPVFLPEGTTFRANLDPASVATNEESAAVLCDIGLDTAVEEKGGLNAMISGAELSAGQKQLFSLARAVLRRRVRRRETGVDGGLLLLDEITSGADTATEKRAHRILDSEFGAFTVIMVTHRKEMATSCDRVIMLDAGEVVEDGAPRALLEKEDGLFKALWEL